MQSSGKPRIKHIYRADDSKESQELVVTITFVKGRSRGVSQIGRTGHSHRRMVGAPAPPLYQTSGRRSFHPRFRPLEIWSLEGIKNKVSRLKDFNHSCRSESHTKKGKVEEPESYNSETMLSKSLPEGQQPSN